MVAFFLSNKTNKVAVSTANILIPVEITGGGSISLTKVEYYTKKTTNWQFFFIESIFTIITVGLSINYYFMMYS